MIVLFGPAGAGKTVQGQLLAKTHGWTWVSVGQILRDSSDSEVLDTMSEGKLAPDELVDKIISDAILASNGSRIVIDGFPRELGQAEWLMGFCAKYSRPLSLVIVLDVPEDVVIDRLTKRGRADDTPDSIRERLGIYFDQMNPILEYFNSESVKIAHIDGVGTIDEISYRIDNKLIEENML